MIVSAGESLIDLIGEGEGQRRFVAQPGGSPFNVAIALAALGAPSGFLCPTSQDIFGGELRAHLARSGVTHLLPTPIAAPTALAIVSTDGEGHPQYAFHRGETADRCLEAGALIDALPSSLHTLHFGSLALAQEDDWGAWRAVVMAARERGAHISLDPNVRPALIDDLVGYRARLDEALTLSDLVKVSDEDLALLKPQRGPETVAQDWLVRHNLELVVLTLGARGAKAWTRSGLASAHAEPLSGPMVDTVGAGDTFQAALLAHRVDRPPAALSSEEELKELLRFACMAAGLNCQRAGCQPPKRDEVESALR